MAAFNVDDPRHQRAQQRAAAKRSMGPTRGVERAQVGEISGRHAAHQLGRQEQFRGLALQSELSRQRGKQFDKSLGLASQKLGFRRSEFDENLRRERSGLNQTMFMGLLGAGFSALEGRRRAKALQSQLAEQKYTQGLLEDYINSVSGRRTTTFGLSSGGPGEGRIK